MSEPATIKTEWSGKTVYCCDKHYQQLSAIARMLVGFAPMATVNTGTESCANCENEAKANGGGK